MVPCFISVCLCVRITSISMCMCICMYVCVCVNFNIPVRMWVWTQPLSITSYALLSPKPTLLRRPPHSLFTLTPSRFSRYLHGMLIEWRLFGRVRRCCCCSQIAKHQYNTGGGIETNRIAQQMIVVVTDVAEGAVSGSGHRLYAAT